MKRLSKTNYRQNAALAILCMLNLIRNRRAAQFCLVFLCSGLSATALAAPNRAPTVSIVAPVAGTNYTPPASMNISANAADTDGTITKVQFYAGTTLIGTTTLKPYSVVWSNVPNGTYMLTAKATDNALAVATSTAVAVTVAGAKIAVTSPRPGSDVVGDQVTIDGTFVGDYTTVIWVDNGNTTRRAYINGPTTFRAFMPVMLGQNTYAVSVVRRDKTSDSYTFSLNGTGSPLVSFNTPSGTEFQMPGELQFSVIADTPNGTVQSVKLYKDNVLLATKTTAPYQAAFTPSGPGDVILRADLLDTLGLSVSASKTVKVIAANATPTVLITSPGAGSSFVAPSNVSATANVSDPNGGVQEVSYFLNGAFLAVTNIQPYSYTWTVTAPGTYTLTAVAKDDRGASSVPASVVFNATVPNVQPTVNLTAPANGAAYPAFATIALSANAADTDGTVTKVDFYRGGTLMGTDYEAPYNFAWEKVAPGSYRITAKVTDSKGAESTSAHIDVVVSEVPPQLPPTVSLTSPAEGATLTNGQNLLLQATATAESGSAVAKVDYFNGAVLIGSTSTAPFALTWTSLRTGTYQVKATVTDSRGLSSSTPPRTVTVKAAPLAAQFTVPAVDAKVLLEKQVLVTIRAFSEASTIKNIELFNGAMLISAIVPEAPSNGGDYSFYWTPSIAGVQTLTVKVVDSLDVITIAERQIEVLAAASLTMAVNGNYHVVPAYVELRAFTTPVPGTTIARVDFIRDGVVIGSSTSAPYQFQWNRAPVGSHIITSRALDSRGFETVSEPINVTVANASEVVLTPGLDGANVTDDRINLSGMVSAPLNSAVLVNGITTRIDEAGRFFANGVPLQLGANTLKVQIVTNDAITGEKPVAVYSSGAAPFVVLANTVEAMRKADVKFTVVTRGNVAIGRISLQCIAGNSVGLDFASAAELALATCTYGSPGIHKALVKIYDRGGTLAYETTRGVKVNSPEFEAKVMRAVFKGMTARLADRNPAEALKMFSISMRPKFQKIFSALDSELSNIDAQLGRIDAVNLLGQIGSITILREVDGKTQAFIVQMVRGDDGIWRMEDM